MNDISIHQRKLVILFSIVFSILLIIQPVSNVTGSEINTDLLQVKQGDKFSFEIKDLPESLGAFYVFNEESEEVLYIYKGEKIQVVINNNELNSEMQLNVIYTNLDTNKKITTDLNVMGLMEFVVIADWDYWYNHLQVDWIDESSYPADKEIINTTTEFGYISLYSKDLTEEEQEYTAHAKRSQDELRFTHYKETGVLKEFYSRTSLEYDDGNIDENIFHIINVDYLGSMDSESDPLILDFPLYFSIVSINLIVILIRKYRRLSKNH